MIKLLIQIMILILLVSMLLLFYPSSESMDDDLCLIKQGNLTYSFYNYSTGEVTTKISNHSIYIDICGKI